MPEPHRTTIGSTSVVFAEAARQACLHARVLGASHCIEAAPNKANRFKGCKTFRSINTVLLDCLHAGSVPSMLLKRLLTFMASRMPRPIFTVLSLGLMEQPVDLGQQLSAALRAAPKGGAVRHGGLTRLWHMHARHMQYGAYKERSRIGVNLGKVSLGIKLVHQGLQPFPLALWPPSSWLCLLLHMAVGVQHGALGAGLASSAQTTMLLRRGLPCQGRPIIAAPSHAATMQCLRM